MTDECPTHKDNIVLAHDPSADPIDFTDESGEFKGVAADYVSLIESRLGMEFQIPNISTWNEVLEKTKNREIDVLCAFSKSPGREEYMLFTDPYIEIPIVILTRKDDDRHLSLDEMGEMNITFTEGWIVDDFLSDYPEKLNIVPAVDSQMAMDYLITGEVDAWVTALTVASVEIRKHSVTDIRVAGETDLSFKLAFASRSDWPILNQILSKGLDLITLSEKEAIFDRWIHIETVGEFPTKAFLLIITAIVTAMALTTLTVFLWNKSLQRQVAQRTTQLQSIEAKH